MGKQVYFYLLLEDLEALEAGIRKHTPDLILMPACSYVSKPEAFSSFRDVRDSYYGCCYLTRPHLLDLIRYKFSPKRGEHGEYCFLNSPLSAIEFDVPRLFSGKLTRGRFYVPSDYLSEDRREVLRPSPEFSKWVDRVLNTARRLFPLDQERANGCRLGPAARAALERGEFTLRRI